MGVGAEFPLGMVASVPAIRALKKRKRGRNIAKDQIREQAEAVVRHLLDQK